MAYKTDVRLFVVHYSNGSNDFEVIKSFREIQDELVRANHIKWIKELDIDLEGAIEVKKKWFTPQRYRTKEPIDNKYLLSKRWNQIWNGEE